jgi:hypothetical protein
MNPCPSPVLALGKIWVESLLFQNEARWLSHRNVLIDSTVTFSDNSLVQLDFQIFIDWYFWSFDKTKFTFIRQV